MGQSWSEPAVIDVDDPHMTSCPLSGLAPGEMYRVTVCAKTTAGCGQPFTVDLHTPHSGRELSFASISNFDLWNNATSFNLVPFSLISRTPECRRTIHFAAVLRNKLKNMRGVRVVNQSFIHVTDNRNT